MNITKDQTRAVEQAPVQEADTAVWQAPEIVVVDTALEVTAYSLSSR